MAELAVPSLGAGLGFYLGGSTGAAVGWMLGSYAVADSSIDSPTLGDLSIQTSSYGTMLPMISGKQRIAGNIIWAQDKIFHNGGTDKQGNPSDNSYTVSMAIALCVGSINGISRWWENGELKGEYGTGQSKLPGTLYLGTDTQTADPLMESILGVGEVPAYRGISYIVLQDYNIGTGGSVPQFSFEVLKSGAF